MTTTRLPRSRSRGQLVLDWLIDRAIRAALWLLLRLPWRRRLALAAWVMSRIVAPLAGWGTRVRDNLAMVMPDLPPATVARLVNEVHANMGRTLVELYAPEEFLSRVAGEPLTGPGVDALAQAHEQGRPVLLVTGHIGNYDAMRAALIARGYRVGGLYKPMANRFFNDHYVATVERIGRPLFPRSRSGNRAMLTFLRSGGMLGLVLDQHVSDGAALSFMGVPARTALSAAQMALKYDALVVPVYGIRRPDLSFSLIVGAPVPHGDPAAMTQALNDDLERQVRAHPGQWMWTHRRWRRMRPPTPPQPSGKDTA